MPKTKEVQWNVQKGLVAPEWQWAYDRLVAAWPISAGGGSTLHDVLGRNDAIQTGSDTSSGWEIAEWGHAVRGLASSNRRWLPAATDPFNLSVYTIAAVCTVESTEAFNRIVSRWNVSELFLFGMGNDLGRLRFLAKIGGNNVSAQSPTGFVLNQRFVLLGEVDGATVRLFVDGVETASSTGTGTADTAAEPFSIAGNNFDGDGTGWLGPIGAVYFWSRLLSAAEKRQLTEDPFGPFRMARRTIAKVAVTPGLNPHGPLGHPLYGALAGPIAA